MKRLPLLCILLLLFSFSKAEENGDPYLVKTKNFELTHFSLQQIGLGITAVLYNPYKVKVNIDEILIDVFMNGKKLGTITEASEQVKIRKQSAFDLPLGIDVKTGSTVAAFFKEGAKLALMGKKVGVDFKGYIKVKALGFIPIKVKIDQTEYFTLKDILKNNKKPVLDEKTK